MSLGDSMARPGALFADSLFNLADKALNFASISLSSAIGLQVGVAGKCAGLLPDCAFDFVKLACCLIVRARFHHGSLLCWVVAFGSLRSVNGSSALTVCDQVALFGKFPCLI